MSEWAWLGGDAALLPYMPNSQMDRMYRDILHELNEILFTTKYLSYLVSYKSEVLEVWVLDC